MFDIQTIRRLAEQAGQQLLGATRKECSPAKTDESRATAVACPCYRQIVAGLGKLAPDVPVLPDQTATADRRQDGGRHWLVTPLGNTEALEGSGELTISIALIEHGEPVLGVVHAPSLRTTYWGARGQGAYKAIAGSAPQRLSVAYPQEHGQAWRLAGSATHVGRELPGLLNSLPRAQPGNVEHALRLCQVAEGAADLYPCMGPASAWATAAAQAVVSAAGGKVLTWPDLQPLRYPPLSDDWRLPSLIACATGHADWAAQPDSTVDEHRRQDRPCEVVWHRTQVSQRMRADMLGQQPCCIWLTGLSGSGKSTIANALELSLHQAGKLTFLLDGDNIRHGLNRDLGMSVQDRVENVRRVGEVAKLMVDAGLIVVSAFISPFRQDRERVRSMFPPEQFIEVFVDTPLDVCEQRDPKGLYRKAREGLIRDFTGIDSPYEAPDQADIVLRTTEMDVQQCVSHIRALLARR